MIWQRPKSTGWTFYLGTPSMYLSCGTCTVHMGLERGCVCAVQHVRNVSADFYGTVKALLRYMTGGRQMVNPQQGQGPYKDIVSTIEMYRAASHIYLIIDSSAYYFLV